MLLGLTGGYCSGKNRAAALLEARGWTGLDVDRFGHRALELVREAVVGRFEAEARRRFGRGLVDAEGRLDRRLLGSIVFSHPALLAAHEAIVHPAMFRLVGEEIEELRSRARAEGREEPRILLNAAILYKMPHLGSCEAVLEIRAPLLLRLRRARARDGLGPLRALQRIGSQAPLWRLRPPSAPPVLLVANGGSEGELDLALEACLRRLGRGRPEDQAR